MNNERQEVQALLDAAKEKIDHVRERVDAKKACMLRLRTGVITLPHPNLDEFEALVDAVNDLQQALVALQKALP